MLVYNCKYLMLYLKLEMEIVIMNKLESAICYGQLSLKCMNPFFHRPQTIYAFAQENGPFDAEKFNKDQQAYVDSLAHQTYKKLVSGYEVIDLQGTKETSPIIAEAYKDVLVCKNKDHTVVKYLGCEEMTEAFVKPARTNGQKISGEKITDVVIETIFDLYYGEGFTVSFKGKDRWIAVIAQDSSDGIKGRQEIVLTVLDEKTKCIVTDRALKYDVFTELRAPLMQVSIIHGEDCSEMAETVKRQIYPESTIVTMKSQSGQQITITTTLETDMCDYHCFNVLLRDGKAYAIDLGSQTVLTLEEYLDGFLREAPDLVFTLGEYNHNPYKALDWKSKDELFECFGCGATVNVKGDTAEFE